MKNELIKFIENEIGYEHLNVNKAIKKYFKGKEIEWKQPKIMYVHETHTLSCSNGELYLSGDFGEIVFDCEALFIDLPVIVKFVYQARAEIDKMIKEQVEEVTRLVTQ